LSESVASQLVSDVPLGVFLSGGIDSSTVAWYAQKHASVKMDTFSIGFDSADFDESSYARSVAKHLGTNHHERMVTAKDALEAVHAVPEVFSEPVADASVLPTMLLSEFAKKNVTVALGGDGADELFAGYPTFGADAVARLYQAVPRPVREVVQKAVSALPADESYFSAISNAKKFTGSDDADTEFRHMEWLGSFSREGRESLLGSADNSVFDDVVRYRNEFPQHDALNRLLYVYARTYLMDGVLVKVDRASMNSGLEVRAPFLSKEVAEYAFSLPSHLKYRNGTSKYLLKKMMQGRLPDGILHRKKKGFGIPLARWLKHELRPLCTDLLSPSELGKHGLLNPAYANQLMTEHFEGRQDNRKQLWNLMVFQMWYNRWIG
jgi:asparagine synthase (glutamine-hydrolysing)